MSTPIPTLSELVPYYHRKDLLEKVVIQLKKEFNWVSLEINFVGKDITPYQELYQQVLPLIDDLLNNDYIKLLSLLYRIDIEEDFLNKKLKVNPHADTDEIITDLILKRVLQKVIIREMYKA